MNKKWQTNQKLSFSTSVRISYESKYDNWQHEIKEKELTEEAVQGWAGRRLTLYKGFTDIPLQNEHLNAKHVTAYFENVTSNLIKCQKQVCFLQNRSSS